MKVLYGRSDWPHVGNVTVITEGQPPVVAVLSAYPLLSSATYLVPDTVWWQVRANLIAAGIEVCLTHPHEYEEWGHG